MVSLEFLPSLSSLLKVQRPTLIHRDLSWLQFNERVLSEAASPSNPLLERVKFLAISSSNLDEFFMIRVASLDRSIALANRKLDLMEARRLEPVRAALLKAVRAFHAKQVQILNALSAELANSGIHIVTQIRRGEPAHHIARELFEAEILPKLQPPESFSLEKLSQLQNLQSAAILPNDLWLRIPRSLPTMVSKITENQIHFFFVDHLLSTFLGPSVPEVWKTSFIRLTRDADFPYDLEDTDPESIPDIVRTKISGRERGKPIRLQYMGDINSETVEKMAAQLKLEAEHVFAAPATLNLHGLWNVVNQTPENFCQNREVKYPALNSKLPEAFDSVDLIFEKLRERDYLLHHPYDSFDAYVNFIRAAAMDPNVTQIEQTVYRMDALSPVVEILKGAARTKKVKVIIELRARFDELNNLRLTEELKSAGVHVAFGFGKLKVHAKVALITRKEGNEEKWYTHLSTGNYNSATARMYTDMAILTYNQEIGSDARHFFDSLYEEHVPKTFKQLLVAPTRLARRLESHIREEAEAARQGHKARIIVKVNALVDDGIIQRLYEASQAGVQVDLIVRGACSLVPGVKGLSENIRVVSIVDRFLEHSRIYYFGHSKKLYLSSADWMPRNLFSRLEIAFPVIDPRIYSYLEEVVLPAYLNDTAKARELTPKGFWKERMRPSETNLRSQVFFRELSLRNYRGTPLQ